MQNSSDDTRSLDPITRPPRLVEMAREALRARIVDGDWALGEKISESSVARQLEVSKTPVREALVLLRQEGLVDIRPQSGTRVFTLAAGELNHICELRQALETTAVRLAFERALPTLGNELAGIVESMTAAREQNDTRRYLRLDDAFHAALIRQSGNPYLVTSYDLVAGKIAALRTHLGTDPHHLQKSYDEHCRLATLVAEGDLEKTLGLLTSHIARKEGSYWEHLQLE